MASTDLEHAFHLIGSRVAGRIGEADIAEARVEDTAGRSRARGPAAPPLRTRSRKPTAPRPAPVCSAASARCAVAMIRSVASATDMPVFFRLCVSLADTPMQYISHAARKSPFQPLLVEDECREDHRPAGRHPVRTRSGKDRSVSAICGTLVGWTNEPTWMISTPVAASCADPVGFSVRSGRSRAPSGVRPAARLHGGSVMPVLIAGLRSPPPSPSCCCSRPCRMSGPSLP